MTTASVEKRHRVDVIINARSGVPGKEAISEQVVAALAAHGVSAHVELVHSFDQLAAASARARAGDAEMVVAGGGDGTIAHIAERLLDVPKTLGVLPLGTFNYFAQRIGVPLDVDGAIDVLATGHPGQVSVGEVNGRVFLNNSGIGLYPSLLKKREQAYVHIGRSQMAAYLSAAVAMLQPPSLLNLGLVADGVELSRRTPLMFVGANPEQLTDYGIPGSECLDAGRLAVYITKPLPTSRLWRLAARAMVRGLYGSDELELVCARELVVTLRRSRVRVAMDGEITRLKLPLRYRWRVDALRVQLPAAPRSDSDGASTQ
jgi:diacylglycerol kinase family enzyme